MPKFVIKTNKVKEPTVDVYLKADYSGGITMMVGEWCIFTLNADGTGTLDPSITKDNEEGIQVDSDNLYRIVLR